MSTATLDPTAVRRWNRYLEYKPTDFAWLSCAPSHWQLLPLKRRVRIQYGLGQPPAPKPDGLPLIRATNVKRGRIADEGMMYIDANEVPESRDAVLRSGDIIVVRSGAYTGDSAIIPDNYAGAIAGYDMVVRSNKDHSRYLSWQLLSTEIEAYQFQLVKLRAAQPHLNAEELGETIVCVPPLAEQRAIAAFLDRETARIDALITRKERLIELLEEKRQAVISHTVTRGLDPTAPTKDSGVPWLGRVPAHWELCRVNSVCRVVRGASPRPAGDLRYFNGDHTPWITVAEVTKDEQKYLTSTDSFLTAEGQTLSRTLPVGTFVLTNSGATLGVPKILKISGCINDGSVAFYDLKKSVSKDFLYYFFRSQTEDLGIRMYQGMGQPNLNTNLVGSIIVPMPPLEEQRLIATRLDETVDRTRQLVVTIRAGIARLQEYRTALISAAVTGQIDVRGEVPS